MTDIIAGRLHFLRDAAGATLDQVAETTGMSKSQLWALEANRVPRPSVQTISRLAVYYGVTVEWLVEGGSDADSRDAAFYHEYRSQPAKMKARVRRLASIVMEGDVP